MSDQIFTCSEVRDQLALLLYGELSFDEEERLDQHIDGCAACRAALDQQKTLHAAIDEIAVAPSPALLANCRDGLFDALDLQTPGLADANHSNAVDSEKHASWWSQVLASFEGKWTAGWMKPAGAFALLAIGFMSARMIPSAGPGAGVNTMDLANLGAAQVRNVQEDANGRVNIVLNETKQRTVSGNMQDAMIRNLLVAAAKSSADPGLRAETVTILVSGTSSADVRDALVFALENDQNTVVRWRAMEGLKSYAQDPAVQTALARVLQRDVNPGMRTQAIDLLTSGTGPAIDRDVVGVLQEMVSREDPREDNTYVRERAQKMLEAVKASAGVY